MPRRIEYNTGRIESHSAARLPHKDPSMRIALVNPMARNSQGYHTIGVTIPHLGLQVLARKVQAPHTVDIIDEIFGSERTEEWLTPERYDLVGITAYSSGATRAYELAGLCRRRTLPCVMGGPHAWACPDEAQRYFDSVAVGECDDIWPQIVDDAARGRLAPRYEGAPARLSGGGGAAAQGIRPINGRYDVGAIQTSRGCPIGCDFCSVTKFNGRTIRRRPVGEIVAEWNELDRRFLVVVDDNFYGVGPTHAEQAKEILRGLIRHGKTRRWFGQTSINMGADPEALKLAYKAGCRGMLVGFESLNPASIEGYHKGLNSGLIGRYKELIGGFHRAGLSVFGCFIVGADEDSPETVSQTALDAVRLGVDIVQVTHLTPLPGTGLYRKMLSEGRITATDYPKDWERYTFVDTVFTPRGMSAQSLDEASFDLRCGAAFEPWVYKRALKTLWMTRSLSTAAFVYGVNRGFKRVSQALVARDRHRFEGLERNEDRLATIRQSFKLRCGRQPASTSP